VVTLIPLVPLITILQTVNYYIFFNHQLKLFLHCKGGTEAASDMALTNTKKVYTSQTL